MSQFINKILGRDENETHSATVIKTQANLPSGNDKVNVQRQTGPADQNIEGRTVERDGVSIKSTVSSDAVSSVSMVNQRKLNDLVSKLGTTFSQIDSYAKKQSEKINEEIEREINEVVARTRREQDDLLHKANEHTSKIDLEYRGKLQRMVEEIDADKAKRIAEIEQQLNEQQAGILEAARNEIDRLNQKAANLKIGALQQAQERAAAEASNITAQATNLPPSTMAHGSGTTTIKTQVSSGPTIQKDNNHGSSNSKTTASASSSNSEAKTIETLASQSTGSRSQTSTK